MTKSILDGRRPARIPDSASDVQSSAIFISPQGKKYRVSRVEVGGVQLRTGRGTIWLNDLVATQCNGWQYWVKQTETSGI